MKAQPVHIVVLRFSAMGDVAMMLPVLKAALDQHPELRLTVVSKPFFEPFFQDIPRLTFFSADVKHEYKGFLGLRRLAKAIVKLQPDAVADLHNVLRANVVLRFLKLKGIKGEQINKGRAEKKALVRLTHKKIKPLKSTHQRYADVFEALGFKIYLEKAQPLNKPTPLPKVKRIIETTALPKIGIAPFAAHHGKQYPLDRIEAVLSDLATTVHVYLFGGGDEERKALKKLAEKHKHVSVVVGQLSFKEEINLIAQLQAMVSMDSGNGHIAANFGIPVITIWGVTHPYAGFKPFFQPDENQLLPDLQQFPFIPTSIYGNKFPEGYLSCFDTINPKQVSARIKEVLRLTTRHHNR